MQGTIGFTGTLSGQIDDSGSEGTSNYNELTNKPSINSVPLVGNKTTEDLHLFTGDYDDLNDKPSINGITLSGNKTTADLGLFSGNYNDLTNKPTLFDGDYDSLTDRPTINNIVLTGNKTTADLGLFSGNYNDLTNKPTLFDGDYDSLSSRPQINGNLLTGNKTTADLGLFSGNYNDLTNKPALFSGDYNDLTNKPTIPVIDMSPSGAATEVMDDIEVDGTVYEVVDAAARGIIGDGQLDPGFTATNLTGAANELKSNLTNNTYSTTGLTTHTDATLQYGGYVTVGKMVIVNMRINITNSIGAYNEIVKGLPYPVSYPSNYIAITDSKGLGMYLSTGGSIQNSVSVPSGAIQISGVYLSI